MVTMAVVLLVSATIYWTRASTPASAPIFMCISHQSKYRITSVCVGTVCEYMILRLLQLSTLTLLPGRSVGVLGDDGWLDVSVFGSSCRRLRTICCATSLASMGIMSIRACWISCLTTSAIIDRRLPGASGGGGGVPRVTCPVMCRDVCDAEDIPLFGMSSDVHPRTVMSLASLGGRPEASHRSMTRVSSTSTSGIVIKCVVWLISLACLYAKVCHSPNHAIHGCPVHLYREGVEFNSFCDQPM